MSNPISFTNTSPRFALPFLSAGQSQKEFSVNQAHALLDALMHLVVQGVSDTPPASPVEGECWLVGSSPSGAWSGQPETIAAYEAGVWLFVTPVEEMRAFDTAAGQATRFSSGSWKYASVVASPSGGSTVDVEARTAIGAIIDALTENGLIASS